jgi:hypothetical protein
MTTSKGMGWSLEYEDWQFPVVSRVQKQIAFGNDNKKTKAAPAPTAALLLNCGVAFELRS